MKEIFSSYCNTYPFNYLLRDKELLAMQVGHPTQVGKFKRVACVQRHQSTWILTRLWLWFCAQVCNSNMQQAEGIMQEMKSNMQEIEGNMQEMDGNMQEMDGNIQEMELNAGKQ